jgi:RNA polymerase primary sigma factor
LSPLTLYLQRLNETPLLSAEQERGLARRAAAGDVQARIHLVRSNLRLVRVAHNYQGRGLELTDLVAEGTLGLIRAAELFDPSSGTRFGTYAVYWVKQSIGRGLVNTAPTIRLPARMARLLVRWHLATAALREELGRPPTEEEVAERMSLSARKLRRVKDALRTRNAAPLAGRDGGGRGLEELVAAGRGAAPDAALACGEELGKAMRLVEALEPRQREVLRLRFGLGGQGLKTLREIGERLRLTRERVRQIERQALARLQEQLGCQVATPAFPAASSWVRSVRRAAIASSCFRVSLHPGAPTHAGPVGERG